MPALTVLGGHGFVGGNYVKQYYDQACGNIVSVNDRNDYRVKSKDVLYFIATSNNYNVFSNPFLDIETNLHTLIEVLENWRLRVDSGEGVFNYISSWFVYGPQQEPHNVPETAPCNPRGFYSITKHAAEQLLISYCETFNLRYRILRLANVVGPGAPASKKKNAIQHMINELAKGTDITVYGDGSQFRDVIHVDDCVRAIECVINAETTDEVYNIGIGGGDAWPLIKIFEFAKRETKSSAEISLIKPPEFHSRVQVHSFTMNVRKLWWLGFQPQYLGEKLFRSILP